MDVRWNNSHMFNLRQMDAFPFEVFYSRIFIFWIICRHFYLFFTSHYIYSFPFFHSFSLSLSFSSPFLYFSSPLSLSPHTTNTHTEASLILSVVIRSFRVISHRYSNSYILVSIKESKRRHVVAQ